MRTQHPARSTQHPARLSLVAVFLIAVLLAACAPAPAPTAVVQQATAVPSLTATRAADVAATLAGTFTAQAPTATLPPTQTPIVITVPPTTGDQIEPPLDITLPDGWRFGYDAQVFGDLDSTIRAIPVAIYAGPVTGGTGYIVLYWAFPNLSAPDDASMASAILGVTPVGAATPTPDLFADGIRLLRLAVVEQGCNIGTDLRRSYRVGLLSAIGTQFSAVTCPALPDTRGWFAGVQEQGLNFVFFAYTDPIAAMDTAQGELQSILDSVRFRPLPPPTTPTPAATATPAP